MESSELPLTKWPALGGAVNVFMMNHWQGQCQNQIAHAPAMQFISSVRWLTGFICKSTEDNQLGWGGSKPFFVVGGGRFKLAFNSRIDPRTAFQIRQKSRLLVPKANCPWLVLHLVCDAFVHLA
jgi:hypothetical protein